MAEERVALEDELGDVVQKARFGLGLDLDALAAATGIPPARLSAFEAYRERPTDEEIGRLAQALRLSAPALARLRDEPAVVPAALPAGFVRLHRPEFRVNAYLFLGPPTVLIDAGVHPEEVRRHTDRLDVILITHEHHDHIDRLKDLRTLGRPTVYGHEELAAFLTEVRPIRDGEEVAGFRALATPGHSALGLSYVGHGAMATGDAVYARSIGRAETPAAYPASLATLAAVLRLPPETVLLPGHGPTSTVAAERIGNPFGPGPA